MPNNALQEFFSIRFRRLLTGDPDGLPPWIQMIGEGEGAGLYMPTDAPWVVHADLATLVGGIRALLMQALHPGSLQGVRSHSRYQNDPLGRLSGTIRWLTITTFGARETILAEANRVNRMHDRVKGTYQSAVGEQRSYRAADEDLLLWVHVAFMDSFLRCHQMYSPRPIPGGADAYVRLWAKSVEPLGLAVAPANEADLLATLENFRSELKADAATREVIEWIRRPPLPFASRPIYALLFQAAVASMPPDDQKLIGASGLPRWMVRPVTRVLLRGIRLAIGADSPIETAAIARLRRAGLV